MLFRCSFPIGLGIQKVRTQLNYLKIRDAAVQGNGNYFPSLDIDLEKYQIDNWRFEVITIHRTSST